MVMMSLYAVGSLLFGLRQEGNPDRRPDYPARRREQVKEDDAEKAKKRARIREQELTEQQLREKALAEEEARRQAMAAA